MERKKRKVRKRQGDDAYMASKHLKKNMCMRVTQRSKPTMADPATADGPFEHGIQNRKSERQTPGCQLVRDGIRRQSNKKKHTLNKTPIEGLFTFFLLLFFFYFCPSFLFAHWTSASTARTHGHALQKKEGKKRKGTFNPFGCLPMGQSKCYQFSLSLSLSLL